MLTENQLSPNGSAHDMINSPAASLRVHPAWFWLILLLAIAMRLWLAAYNADANDSHLEVIHRIMITGELPVAGDCWQCYHAKAFHYPAAVLLARLSIDNPIDQLLLLQHVNLALGIATLLLLWSWLRDRDLADEWKLALFGLFALNPRLATINIQVTNDTLVIFAATACFFCYVRFLERRRFAHLWAALAFCSLSVAAKASGIVVAILLFLHLLVLALFNLRRLGRLKGRIAATALIAAVVFAPAPFFGYAQNYSAEGTPLANNIPKFPFPNWSEDKRWSKAGTTSIVNTYLTFRWLNLVQYPYLIKGPVLYPEHRTNHWAQVYGRHMFSRFEHWPESWTTNGYWATRVGQASMILGLVPLALLIAGLGSFAFVLAARVRGTRELKSLAADPDVFLAATFVIMIAMSLKLSLDFQTYRIMKAIYIYPGLIGALALTARGASLFAAKAPLWGDRLVHRLAVALIAVHLLDLAILGTDLQARYTQQAQRLAAFEPAAATSPDQVRLVQLEPHVGRGSRPVRRNESFSGVDLTGGYRKFKYGLGTHALSFVAFDLGGGYKRFDVSMALADEAYSTDGVQFEIWGDSRLLYRSPKMIDHQLDKATVDVSGVDTLALKVQPLGSSYGDLANWLQPVLTRN